VQQKAQEQAAQPVRRAIAAPGTERMLIPPGARTAQPTIAETVQVQPGDENVKLLQQYNWLKAQVGHLVVQAARGKSPELYAEVLLDNLPPFITPGEILERLKVDDALTQLAQIDERVTQYAEWFEEFRDAVLEFLEPEDSAQGLPEASGGTEMDEASEGGEA
jgi:hypothetical protein